MPYNVNIPDKRGKHMKETLMDEQSFKDKELESIEPHFVKNNLLKIIRDNKHINNGKYSKLFNGVIKLCNSK
jgi:hypothetical protein